MSTFLFAPHHRARLVRFASSGVCALILGGCASFSGIAPQSTQSDGHSIDGRVLENSAAMQAAAINAAWPSTTWWQAYRDPQLDQLIAQAVAQSPTLKIAQARIRQANAMAGIANAATLPKIGASASLTRELFTSDGLYPPPLGGNWDWSNDARIKASYDLDLWDKDRNTLEAAQGIAQVSVAEARAAQLSLEATIVHTYLQLATQYVMQDLATAALAQQQTIANIAQRRLKAGIGTNLEVSQAETSLPSSRTTIEKVNESIALLRNQLATLIGQGPAAGDAIQRPFLANSISTANQSNAALAISLPSNVPAELIGRRPDVIAQRWQVEALGKQIDVAKAAFYPNINLSAFIGFESIGLSQFLNNVSAVRGIAPAISLPIFDGGRLRANLSAQTAQLDAAIESYNNTLLHALQSVADQIVKLKSQQLQQQQSEQAMTLAQKSFDLAQRGFKAGLTPYINVIHAQITLLQEQQKVAQARAAYLDAWALLMQALGGGLGDDLPTPNIAPAASTS